jgi:2-desacetyl-2-hydroxyethyl bacteriochlorophyllide A dehydrogenase
MKAKYLYFTAPNQIEVREQMLPSLSEGEVLVKSICSAISPGTEMLIYKGKFPKESSDHIDPVSSQLNYPFQYGYACVGEVVEVGVDVEQDWVQKLVFSFQPHGDFFITTPEYLFPLPAWCPVETACFLANMETSVNLVQDAAPIVGENVIVFGQGVVGLLTASLLAEFPLQDLVTVDNYPERRAASKGIGLSASLNPVDPDFREQVFELIPEGADLAIEASGNPSALDDAITLTRFGGRIVIGSWYGQRKASIDLGGKFHRSRMQLISSQVSTISASLSDRWDKIRRLETAWQALMRIRPEKWVTHRFKLDQAADAYAMLAEAPGKSIQTVFDYQ